MNTYFIPMDGLIWIGIAVLIMAVAVSFAIALMLGFILGESEYRFVKKHRGDIE